MRSYAFSADKLILTSMLSCAAAGNLSSANDAGTASPDPCSGLEVHSIQRPMVPGVAAGSAKFNYKYRYISGDASAPTVIFIPGGPGDPSMQFRNARGAFGFPASFGVVLTDPRGAGCNKLPGKSF